MKILFIHTSAGAGHFKAAEALYRGIRKESGHDTVLVDALDYSSPFFKKFYKWIYYTLISKLPWMWGFFFGAANIFWLQPLVRSARRIYNACNTLKLRRFLQEEQFDYIFATHFLPAEVAGALKRSGRISSKLVTVITDFDVHRIWLSESTDFYAVATDWTKEKLRKLGVAPERIIVSGIPTDEKFAAFVDIRALKKKVELYENTFTVLIATGSFGIGPIEAILKELTEFQVIVVCGRNESLFLRVSAKQYRLAKILGLVDNMHELMAVSDVMVTKPGGLSIAEALVSQLPLIFFNAIPGQEAGNIRVLKEYGIGISGYNVKQIGEELMRLRASKDVFLTTLKKTRALARPAAVREILALVK
jgi:processive 1,2-diacylglycerol beta-glucosyltransferase